jgi:hypothetical protein
MNTAAVFAAERLQGPDAASAAANVLAWRRNLNDALRFILHFRKQPQRVHEIDGVVEDAGVSVEALGIANLH